MALAFGLGGLAALTLGLVLLGFGVRALGASSNARASWFRVQGVVSSSSLGGAFGADITYPLPDGRPWTYRTLAVKGESLREGQAVELLVNPAAPTEAHLQGAARRVAPYVLTAVGAVFAMSGLSLLTAGLSVGV